MESVLIQAVSTTHKRHKRCRVSASQKPLCDLRKVDPYLLKHISLCCMQVWASECSYVMHIGQAVSVKITLSFFHASLRSV
jgi:hypothetical protein